MFEPVRRSVLQLLRVPHEPDPPAGAPGTVRVFRAGRNFYKLRLLRWGAGQLGALAGIILSLTLLSRFEEIIEEARIPPSPPALQPADERAAAGGQKRPGPGAPSRAHPKAQRLAERWPSWLFPLLTLVEWGGVVIYLVQIPLTYAMARLDYELRWYMVTDRSLRIRSGLAAVQETTMSFANVQQVVVTQGPLQRLLGIADVRVQSAGGGGDAAEHAGTGASLHTGIFHGVENAVEIRDLILRRLRQFRESGLGDPDDLHPDASPRFGPHDSAGPTGPTSALAAARELLAEARALRRALLVPKG